LKIALLNMMSDAALKATDIQFRRLLASSADAVLHPFTLPEIVRGEKAAAYISESYQTWDEIKSLAPDAMIITGANISEPNLETQVFWDPLREIMDWAEKNTKSTLCSCLASHAVMQFRFEQLRRPLPKKVWGVYEHRTLLPDHPLATGLPILVPVPQSRHNEVTAGQFQAAGLNVILAHSYARVHLAANRDNSLVLMQGHPEYDGVSLLKEYKREVRFFAEGLREDYPPIPDNIVDDAGVELLLAHGKTVREAIGEGGPVPDFPESEAAAHLHEDWKPAAEQVFANWLEIVRKLPA
jgi:homoserine O-succinyltransferase/O-acetyltransferase